MLPILRVARATNNLERISAMYRDGLGLSVLAEFTAHAGFDGVILGNEGAPYLLEFTREAGVEAPRSASPENLLVFYLPDSEEFSATEVRMLEAGFVECPSHNPYWDQCGSTFEDPEGYRVVLSRNAWSA